MIAIFGIMKIQSFLLISIRLLRSFNTHFYPTIFRVRRYFSCRTDICAKNSWLILKLIAIISYFPYSWKHFSLVPHPSLSKHKKLNILHVSLDLSDHSTKKRNYPPWNIRDSLSTIHEIRNKKRASESFESHVRARNSVPIPGGEQPFVHLGHGRNFLDRYCIIIAEGALHPRNCRVRHPWQKASPKTSTIPV